MSDGQRDSRPVYRCPVCGKEHCPGSLGPKTAAEMHGDSFTGAPGLIQTMLDKEKEDKND